MKAALCEVIAACHLLGIPRKLFFVKAFDSDSTPLAVPRRATHHSDLLIVQLGTSWIGQTAICALPKDTLAALMCGNIIDQVAGLLLVHMAPHAIT